MQITSTLNPYAYSIQNNLFENYVNVGVSANRIFPSQSFYLTDNVFNDNYNDSGDGSQGAASLTSANTSNTKIFALKNTYTKTSGADQFFGGFILGMGSNSLVQSNTFTTSGGAGYEFYMEGTRSSKAYKNSFTGSKNNDIGIYGKDAYQSSIICNSLDNLDIGAYFTGDGCDATTLAENFFGDHTTSLYVDQHYDADPMYIRTTTIGQQTYNSNTWLTASSWEANYPVVSSDIAYLTKLGNSRFTIQTPEITTPPSPDWAIPRNPGLNAWFKYLAPHILIAIKCPPEQPGDGGHDGQGLSAMDENVIAGTQPAYDGFEATLWDAQLRLYRNLYEDPELRPAGSDAEGFYNANSEASYAHLAIILSKYDQYMTTDEITLNQLKDLYAQAMSAQEAQSDDLDALNQAASLLLNYIAAARNELLISLQNELASVEVSTDYEMNLKNTLTIILASALTDSPWHWTPEQESNLQAIADQCKNPGGYGVVLARLMLNQFNHVENCETENRNAQTKSSKQGDWKVSPNPTTGNLQISLPEGSNVKTLNLYDQWGKQVKSYKVDLDSTFFWNITDLINGVYYLKLVGEETYSVQKIEIQH